MIERLSIEPSRRCNKGCAFCYNGSGPGGDGSWTREALVAFVRDCAAHGVLAVSFGGGEPLEWPDIFVALDALRGTLFRSLTTNGRPLDDRATFEALVAAAPDKVHVSLHQPREVAQVIAWVHRLEAAGLRCGVNVLVRRARLPEVTQAAAQLRAAGIANDRIVYLPLRGTLADTPTPAEVAAVAGAPFQSMSCLRGCARSPRFVSIDADRAAAWCSYTTSRATLIESTYAALVHALDGLDLQPCWEQMPRLAQLSGASRDGTRVR